MHKPDPIVVEDRFVAWRRRLVLAMILILLLCSLLLGLQATRLLAFERHRGFFAPVWGPNGEYVYYLQRDTLGVVMDPGRLFGGKQVYAYAPRDEMTLRRIRMRDGQVEILRHWADTPARGRWLRQPRGQAFGTVMARIDTGGKSLEFVVNVLVPDAAEVAVQTVGQGDNIINAGIEVMALPGIAAYPAAVIAATGDGRYDVLLHNRHFGRLYPEGVATGLLTSLSRREAYAEQQEFAQLYSAHYARLHQQGMTDAEADAATRRALARQGYEVPPRRLLATAIDAPQPDEKVFTMTTGQLNSGQFGDLQTAIDSPGQAVTRQTEPYPDNTEVGHELNAWDASGAGRYVLRVGDDYYRLINL
ncbi:MAG: hypothetical protein WDZ86_04660 [Gammaproteobacteria bacterium]